MKASRSYRIWEKKQAGHGGRDRRVGKREAVIGKRRRLLDIPLPDHCFPITDMKSKRAAESNSSALALKPFINQVNGNVRISLLPLACSSMKRAIRPYASAR
jgi:hypothetical protein